LAQFLIFFLTFLLIFFTIQKKAAPVANKHFLLKGGDRITSVITNGTVDNLDLKMGMNAYAIIKSS